MDLSSITRFRLRRVNPYRGLVIDETTWAEAHDYHRDHLRLHTLAFHDVGVVAGLNVSAVASPAGSIEVEVSAGVAVDDDGNIIVVSQERKVPFDGVEAGPVYVTIGYEENRVNSEANAPRNAPANRIVESYHLEVTNKAPQAPALELARLYWSAVTAQVKAAGDPANPREDELDQRFRPSAHAARQVPVTIGVVGEDANARLRGLTNLMREVNNVAGYQARYRGGVNLDEGAGGSDLIYVCGPVASEKAVSTLQSHLGRGGVVFADNCHTKSNGAETRKDVHDLASKLGLKLTSLEQGNPLLDIRYPFSEPPAGAIEGEVVGSGRFVASLRDYGCAWSGACGKDTLPRETVRSALEWGVNVAIASVQA
jgi:hypothetical protein